jgi:SAM-dependent methyltransferase
VPGPGADRLEDEWAAMLAAWAIPEELVAAAPEAPYFFDPEVFIAAADEALARSEHTASELAARDALPKGGSVLDVGAGAGAASVRLGAAHVTGVDPSPVLLEAFADRLAATGATTTLVEGTWPAVATTTSTADVVVCHHVLYNVPQLAAFTEALSSHARHRVIIELTSEHPMAWMQPYWQALHGLQQPSRPTADDAMSKSGDDGSCLSAVGSASDPIDWTSSLPSSRPCPHQSTARSSRSGGRSLRSPPARAGVTSDHDRRADPAG